MLKNLQEGFINSCNLVEVPYQEFIVIEGETIYIKGSLKDDCYEDGNIIGTFIFKELQFEADNIKIYKNKEFEYYKNVNGISQKIGTFITTEVSDNDTKGTVKVTAMDYGLKTQKLYESSLNYQSGNITLLDVYNEACSLAGIIAGNETFTNSNFIVDSDQFTGTGVTIRDVFKNIALASCSFVKVMNDDKIYLMLEEQTDEIIEEYTDLEDKRDTSPITCVSMGMSNIQGQDITRKDTDLIQQYGENWLKIYDCRFAYTEAKRIQLIDNIFNKIKGFGYSSFVSKTSFKPYLTCGDRIKFRNREGNLVNSIILRYSHENTEINLEAPSIIKSTVNYENPKKEIDLIKQTEYNVDQQNQIIASVVRNVTTQNNKISQVQQTVNELNSKIGDIADITVSNETSDALLNFTDINLSEPIRIQIHPIQTDISYLYPRENLYPSDTLYLKSRTLRFIRTYVENGVTETENIDYEIPTDLLYYDENNYDEFILDYDSQTCIVNKKIGINMDGTKYLLSEPQTLEFTYPTIILQDGNYTIKLLGYNIGYLFARLMSQNIYTTQFATKAELNSKITQTAQQIELEVAEKVNDDEIIAKLNTAIRDGQGIIELIGNTVKIKSDRFELTETGEIKIVENSLRIITNNNQKVMDFSKSGLRYYNYNSLEIGGLVSTELYMNGRLYLTLYHGESLNISKTSDDGTYFTNFMAFNDINSVPYIRNTASGTLFNDNPSGGIKVNNGLITNWSLRGISGNVTIDGKTFVFKNGLCVEFYQ